MVSPGVLVFKKPCVCGGKHILDWFDRAFGLFGLTWSPVVIAFTHGPLLFSFSVDREEKWSLVVADLLVEFKERVRVRE